MSSFIGRPTQSSKSSCAGHAGSAAGVRPRVLESVTYTEALCRKPPQKSPGGYKACSRRLGCGTIPTQSGLAVPDEQHLRSWQGCQIESKLSRPHTGNT